MFVNFTTLVVGDKFYLRFSGTRLLLSPENAGWVCRDETQLRVRWAASVPDSAILWQVASVSGTVLGLRTDQGEVLARNGASLTLTRNINQAVPWTLSDFSGYSNNQVPGFGWEPHSFSIGIDALWLAFNVLDQLVVADRSSDALLSFLYVTGSRDTLLLGDSPQPCCFNLRTSPQGQWLTLDPQGITRLTNDRAAAVTLRLAAFVSVGSFQLAVVGSSQTLGIQNERLNFVGLTTTPATCSVPIGTRLEFNRPVDLSLTAATQVYTISADLTVHAAQQSEDDHYARSGQQFEFVLNTEQRLKLAYTDILQGRVNVISPWSFPSQNVQAEPPVFEVVGQRRQPGCARNQNFRLNWSPELVPLEPLRPNLFAPSSLRWTSGNSPDNLFYISSTGADRYQRQETELALFPMQGLSLCFVDKDTGQVPPLCGALQLRLYDSNLGKFPTGTFLNFETQCMIWAVGPTTTLNDEGLAHIFMSDNNSLQNPCSLPKASIPSFEFVSFNEVGSRIVGVVVPENLLLQIAFSGSGLTVTLGPGTYNVQALLVIEPKWPTTVVPFFQVYCCTVNPRSIFIAKLCSGFAGAKSNIYQPQSNECDVFMRSKCVVDELFNSSVCGCYQDQRRLAQQGLPEPLTAQMVNRPQCFGSVCALGSAYRQSEWLEGCGTVCQQVIAGNGSVFEQHGVQDLACGGDIYNFTNSNKPSLAEAALEPWVIAVFVVLATIALIFAILFAVYITKSKTKPAGLEPKQSPVTPVTPVTAAAAVPVT